MTKLLMQVELESVNDNHKRVLTCWVDARKDVEVGKVITLKNYPVSDLYWKVVFTGPPVSYYEVNRSGWHVGGL